MTENEIYCYINGFLRWNVSKKTSYIVGNMKFSGKICIINLRNKKKSIFAIVIVRYLEWKKIKKKTGKIKNHWTKFRKWITREKFVHFRSTIDTSRSRTRKIQFMIFIFVKKVFLVSIYIKDVVGKVHLSRLGLHWAFQI